MQRPHQTWWLTDTEIHGMAMQSGSLLSHESALLAAPGFLPGNGSCGGEQSCHRQPRVHAKDLERLQKHHIPPCRVCHTLHSHSVAQQLCLLPMLQCFACQCDAPCRVHTIKVPPCTSLFGTAVCICCPCSTQSTCIPCPVYPCPLYRRSVYARPVYLCPVHHISHALRTQRPLPLCMILSLHVTPTSACRPVR